MLKQRLLPIRLYLHYSPLAENEAFDFKEFVEKSLWNDVVFPHLRPIKLPPMDTFDEDEDLASFQSYAHVLFLDGTFFPLPFNKAYTRSIKETFYYVARDELDVLPIAVSTSNRPLSKDELQILDGFWNDRTATYWGGALNYVYDTRDTHHFHNLLLQTIIEKKVTRLLNKSAEAKEIEEIPSSYRARQQERLKQAQSFKHTIRVKKTLIERRNEQDPERVKMLNHYFDVNERFIKTVLNDVYDCEIFEITPELEFVNPDYGYTAIGTGKFSELEKRVRPTSPIFSLKVKGGAKYDCTYYDEPSTRYDVLIPELFSVCLELNERLDDLPHSDEFTSLKVVTSDNLDKAIFLAPRTPTKESLGLCFLKLEYGSSRVTRKLFDFFENLENDDQVTVWKGENVNESLDPQHLSVTLLYTLEATTKEGEKVRANYRENYTIGF